MTKRSAVVALLFSTLLMFGATSASADDLAEKIDELDALIRLCEQRQSVIDAEVKMQESAIKHSEEGKARQVKSQKTFVEALKKFREKSIPALEQKAKDADKTKAEKAESTLTTIRDLATKLESHLVVIQASIENHDQAIAMARGAISQHEKGSHELDEAITDLRRLRAEFAVRQRKEEAPKETSDD